MKKKIFDKACLGLMVLVAAALMVSGVLPPATAADPIVLRVGDFYPPGHPIRTGFLEKYVKPLEERTKGRVKIDYYGQETLVKAKDILDATITGICDIGNMVYAGSRVPLMFFHQLPGVFSDAQTVNAARAFWKVSKKYLYPEFNKLGLKLLYAHSTSGYQIMTTKKPIRSLADIKDMKIRCAGSVLPHSVKALGSVPISMTMGEVYESLERGVLDGISLGVPSVKKYAFYDIIKYGTVNFDLGGYPGYYAINIKKWKTLPDDIKAAMEGLEDEATTNATQLYVDQVNKDLKEWTEKGIEVIRLAGAEKEKIPDSFTTVWQNWIDLMEKKRYPIKDLIVYWKQCLAEEGLTLPPALMNVVQ